MLERCIDESGGYGRCSAEDVELLALLREARGDFPGAAHCIRQARDGLSSQTEGDFVRRPTERNLMRDEAAYLLKGRAVDEARSIYEALLDLRVVLRP